MIRKSWTNRMKSIYCLPNFVILSQISETAGGRKRMELYVVDNSHLSVKSKPVYWRNPQDVETHFLWDLQPQRKKRKRAGNSQGGKRMQQTENTLRSCSTCKYVSKQNTIPRSPRRSTDSSTILNPAIEEGSKSFSTTGCRSTDESHPRRHGGWRHRKLDYAAHPRKTEKASRLRQQWKKIWKCPTNRRCQADYKHQEAKIARGNIREKCHEEARR